MLFFRLCCRELDLLSRFPFENHVQAGYHQQRKQGGRDDAADNARASGALASPPPMPIAMGKSASQVVSEVIRIGRARTLAASMIASDTLSPVVQSTVGKADQHDRILHHDAYHHDDAHESHDRKVCTRGQEHDDDAHKA